MLNENINDLGLEELEDFNANEKITYLVCALGYNEACGLTDSEVYLGEFELPDEAITFAKNIDLIDILQYAADQTVDISEIAYFSLEVEAIVECDASEDGTEAIDTIWGTQINIG